MYIIVFTLFWPIHYLIMNHTCTTCTCTWRCTWLHSYWLKKLQIIFRDHTCIMSPSKILSSCKSSAYTHDRDIANNSFSSCVHFIRTYVIRWYPGGACSPLVLLINTISQTVLAAVLLDWILRQRKCFLKALSSAKWREWMNRGIRKEWKKYRTCVYHHQRH